MGDEDGAYVRLLKILGTALVCSLILLGYEMLVSAIQDVENQTEMTEISLEYNKVQDTLRVADRRLYQDYIRQMERQHGRRHNRK